MTTSKKSVLSDLPVSPGASLAEELKARGMTEEELAAMLDWPAHAVCDIISGKDSITPDIAAGLEQALGISAEFWLNLEAIYQETLARLQEAKAV